MDSPGKLTRPILIFDLETTGKDPNKDEIVQFAGIICPVDGTPCDAFEFKCRPKIAINPEATQVHGITYKDIANCKPFEFWAPGLVASLPKEFDVAGYNILKFDLPILDRQMAACGFKGIFDRCHIIDSFVLYKKQFPGTLKSVYRQYTGKTLENAHDAMADTAATFQILSAQLALEGSVTIPEIAGKTSTPPDRRIGFSGHLLKNDNGETIFGFGKYKGELVRLHMNYIRWMLAQDFPTKVKEYLIAFCKKLNSEFASLMVEEKRLCIEIELLDKKGDYDAAKTDRLFKVHQKLNTFQKI